VSQAVVPGVGCGWIIGAVGPSNDREGDRRLNGSRKPTIGVDLGADGARTLMLVYNLPRTDAIYQQFNGIVGAAYFVAGLGVTALTSGDEGSCEIVRNPSLKRKPNVRRRLTALQGKVAAVEELQHRCYRLTDLRKF
jgi:Envelope integrity protein A